MKIRMTMYPEIISGHQFLVVYFFFLFSSIKFAFTIKVYKINYIVWLFDLTEILSFSCTYILSTAFKRVYGVLNSASYVSELQDKIQNLCAYYIKMLR